MTFENFLSTSNYGDRIERELQAVCAERAVNRGTRPTEANGRQPYVALRRQNGIGRNNRREENEKRRLYRRIARMDRRFLPIYQNNPDRGGFISVVVNVILTALGLPATEIALANLVAEALYLFYSQYR